MSQMSDYLENKLINHVFRNETYAQAGTVYLALYENDPTDADVGTEMVGGGYARQAISFTTPADGTSSNNADIIFPAAMGDYPEITHVGVRDQLTGGNLLMHKQLTNPVTVLDTNNFRIPLGQLLMTFA